MPMLAKRTRSPSPDDCAVGDCSAASMTCFAGTTEAIAATLLVFKNFLRENSVIQTSSRIRNPLYPRSRQQRLCDGCEVREKSESRSRREIYPMRMQLRARFEVAEYRVQPSFYA